MIISPLENPESFFAVNVEDGSYFVLVNKMKYLTTVKLGYNELGYNEHSVITNKLFGPNWSFYYINQPGYNETRL